MSSDNDKFTPIDEVRQLLLKPDVLIDRISPIIAEILEEHIANSQDEVARAIAPIIGEALRRQVYQAREDIVDALYPIIGQTVNKAIAEALSDLARTIDARIRQNLIRRDIGRYWKARLQGISTAEYRLRELIPFTIREIFLIQRDTGLLICHYSYGEALTDRDLISGMLTAIRDFSREVLGSGKGGELWTIEYEAKHILLEAGGAAFLAVVVDGVEPSGFRDELRRLLVLLHERHYDQLRQFDGRNTALVKQSEQCIEKVFPHPTALPSRSSTSLTFFQRLILIVFALLILLPPLLMSGWWIWRVESRLLALVVIPPTATATPTMQPIATRTPMPTQIASLTVAPTVVLTPTAPAFSGVMTGNVFLRTGPSLDSIRTSLVAPRGALVEVLAQYGEWYYVRVAVPDQDGVEATGWVLEQWVGLTLPVAPDRITPTTMP